MDAGSDFVGACGVLDGDDGGASHVAGGEVDACFHRVFGCLDKFGMGRTLPGLSSVTTRRPSSNDQGLVAALAGLLALRRAGGLGSPGLLICLFVRFRLRLHNDPSAL